MNNPQPGPGVTCQNATVPTTGYHAAKTLTLNGTSRISNAVKRRARAVINDRSIDAQTRAVIRYGLEVNDPWLPDLVRRVDAGETIFETIVLLKRPKLTPAVGTGKDRSIDRNDLLHWR